MFKRRDLKFGIYCLQVGNLKSLVTSNFFFKGMIEGSNFRENLQESPRVWCMTRQGNCDDQILN